MATDLQRPPVDVADGPAHGGFRPDIEGLRAIAVGLVVLYHAGVPGFAGGYVGVDVFFVLSGFLITQSLLREVRRTGGVGLAAFYARRVRRLLPQSALVLALTAAAVRWLLPVTTWRDFGGDVLAAGAYVVNWRLSARSVDYLAEDVDPSPVLHYWSLSVEEQFYVVWPLLLLLAAYIARRRSLDARRTALVLIVVAVVVPSLVWSVTATETLPARAFFDTGTRAWELGAGAVLALWGGSSLSAPRASTWLRGASLAGLLAVAFVVRESTPWPGLTAALVIVPTVVLVALGGRGDDAIERALAARPMQAIGARSYALYLWHWPPLAILAARNGELEIGVALAAVAISLVPTWLSHRYVEDPVRHAPSLKSSVRRTLLLGAVLTAVGVVAGALLVAAVPDETTATVVSEEETGSEERSTAPIGAAALAGRGLPLTDEQMEQELAATSSITPAPTAATDDGPTVHGDGCQVVFAVDEVTTCSYGAAAEDATAHVLLTGDSKATQWGDVLIELAERHGWRVTTVLKSSCPLSTSRPVVRGDEVFGECEVWNERALAEIVELAPDVVITSHTGSTAMGPDGSIGPATLVDGMLAAYEVIEAAGARVVVLLDNPFEGPNVYECVAEHLDDLEVCSFPRPEDGARAVQREVADRGGHATVDLADHLCAETFCPPVIGNVLVYRQGSHITRTYAHTLLDVLDERLAPLVDEAVAD